MIEDHRLRTKIWSGIQHPYKHTLGDFSYANPSYNGTTLESALNWLFAVIYPNTQESVATVGDLPAAGNTIQDYRVVLDDGDGKAASYRWEQREGDVTPQWYKIYDMDWGEDSILSNFLNQTQDVYVYKHGLGDRDENGDLFVGELSGQHIYGGDLADTNLTLHANSGDGVGPQTGYIQYSTILRPTSDNLIDLGDATHQVRTGYFGLSVVVGDMTLSDGSFTSTSGLISFGDENLITTGTLASGVATIDGQIVLKEIATPSTPAATYNSLYFKADDKLYRLDSAGTEKLVGLDFTSSNDNRLVKSVGTGGDALEESGIIVGDTDIMSGVLQLFVGNFGIGGNTITSTDTDGNINISPDGTGEVVLSNLTLSSSTDDVVHVPRTSGIWTATGISIDGSDVVSGITQLNVDDLRLDGNEISATDTNGNIILSPDGTGNIITSTVLRPVTDNTQSLGLTSHRFTDLFLSTSIGDGTNSISMTTLLSFRDALVGAASGHTLFYDGSKWNSSLIDSEVDHGTLLASSLLDDDHSQYLLLAGRSGGQEIFGGTDANDNLLLSSTSNGTKGNILFKESLLPFTSANFSGTWQGLDLGGSANYVRHLYSKGEFKGFRLENFTSVTLPASSGNNVGRAVYATDNSKLYIDNGSAFKVAGVGKYINDEAFNGADLTKTVDVSSEIVDARNCIIQLLDNANNFERIFCKLEAISASQVKITTNVALPAGSYRLIVLE